MNVMWILAKLRLGPVFKKRYTSRFDILICNVHRSVCQFTYIIVECGAAYMIKVKITKYDLI